MGTERGRISRTKRKKDSEKDAAEQDVCVSGEMKLRSFKWTPGESIGRRKCSLISERIKAPPGPELREKR